MPELDLGNVMGPQGIQGIPGNDGQDGPQGVQGEAGKDASINGVNALQIEVGNGLKASQTGNTYSLALSTHAAQHAAGGSDPITPESIGAAVAGGGVMERSATIAVTSEDETYEIFCKKVDAVLATMPDLSVRFVNAYPPGYYRDGYDIAALYKADSDYASLRSIGSYNYHKVSGFMMIKRKHAPYDSPGTWDPLEYFDPPMAVGVEYRTTERYQGKPVYKKLDTDNVIKWRIDGETAWKPEAKYTGAPDALMSTASVVLHVAKTGSDTTGDGSETKPYLTIQKALDSLPKLLLARVTIRVHEGTYSENVVVGPVIAINDIALEGAPDESVKVKTVYVYSVIGNVGLANLDITDTSGDGYNWSLQCSECQYVTMNHIRCTGTAASSYFGAVRLNHTGMVVMNNTVISNKAVAVDVAASVVYMNDKVTGENNTVGIRCGSAWGRVGGYAQKGGAQLGGEEQKGYGGQIW